MDVSLHYGSTEIPLTIPDANIHQVLRPWHNAQDTDNKTLIDRAIASKAGVRFSEDVSGKRLCVLVHDGTRDMPIEDIFDPLFALITGALHVKFIICTGTHSPATAENSAIINEMEKAAGINSIVNYSIHSHDCRSADFIYRGKTSGGTHISFNSLIDDTEIFLALSDVKCHYFAGYSNPIKNFMPGVCSFKTVEQNHSLALDDRSTFCVHPWHPDKKQRDNPLANDQLEGMKMIVGDRPVMSLITISTSGNIQWAKFGPAEETTRDAIETVDRTNSHTVTPVSRMIVSPGGLPNDVSLYIAQRALELTRNSITDGGEILLLAACPDGPGEEHTMENFFNRLLLPIEEILSSIESEYRLFSHKPYKFAQLIRRMRRVWLYSEMDSGLVESAHLYPVDDPQSVVDQWLAEEPDVQISIVDGANKIALY